MSAVGGKCWCDNLQCFQFPSEVKNVFLFIVIALIDTINSFKFRAGFERVCR
jgi:hypothetical protein